MAKVSQGKRLNQNERREAKRWKVSIPCSVECEGIVIEGTIADLTYIGARISEAVRVPFDGAVVTVRFRFGSDDSGREVALKARVIYTLRHIAEGQNTHSFGVEFVQPFKEVNPQLTPVFLCLRRQETKSGQSAK